MFRVLLFFVFVAIAQISIADELSWGVNKTYAESPNVKPNKPMNSPYQDLEARIGVWCGKGQERAYFSFDYIPNLSNIIKVEAEKNVIHAKIKWDNNQEIVTLTQGWGSYFIRFTDDKKAIKNIINSSTVSLEFYWTDQGLVSFKFPLNGSSSAISRIRAICSG